MASKAVYKDLKGWDQLQHLLTYLVPKEKKIWIWRAMARKAISLNRARIRAQKNLSGSPYDPRADGTDKKMLAKILKGDPFNKGRSQTRATVTEDGAVILHPWEQAVKHHFGATQTVRAMTHQELKEQRRNLKEYHRAYNHGERKGNAALFGTKAMIKYGGSSQMDTSCTKEQARTLKKEVGFKKLSLDGGKTHQSATISRLQQTFDMSTAGYIIRKHRISQGKYPKSSWKVTIPSRHVLGLSEQDERALMLYMKQLIAKYAYFDITMPQGQYEYWAADFLSDAA